MPPARKQGVASTKPESPAQRDRLSGQKRKQAPAEDVKKPASKAKAAVDSRFDVSAMFADHEAAGDLLDEEDEDEGDFSDAEGDEGEEEEDEEEDVSSNRIDQPDLLLEEDEEEEDLDEPEEGADGKGNKIKPMSRKKLVRLEQRLAQRGVVYFSRIPPFMKPDKLRHLMSQYGDIGRIYLTPEDQATTRRRKKFRGNKAVKFEDGWVEFADKKVAKAVARALNNTIIGGKKRNWYHDDIWNIRYLKGFKWSHLTERLNYENQVRAQRRTHEVRQARQESNFYLEKVEQAKSLDAMRAKKRQKLPEGEGDQPKYIRRFKQRELAE